MVYGRKVIGVLRFCSAKVGFAQFAAGKPLVPPLTTCFAYVQHSVHKLALVMLSKCPSRFSPIKNGSIIRHWLSVKSVVYPIMHLVCCYIEYIGRFGELLNTGFKEMTLILAAINLQVGVKIRRREHDYEKEYHQNNNSRNINMHNDP